MVSSLLLDSSSEDRNYWKAVVSMSVKNFNWISLTELLKYSVLNIGGKSFTQAEEGWMTLLK